MVFDEKQYYRDNCEKIKKYSRQWYKDHKEYRKEYDKQWAKDNPKKVEKYKKQYYENNKEKLNKYKKQWAKDNPEKRRKSRFKFRYGLSHEDYLKMWESQDGKCAICGKVFILPSDGCVDHNHDTKEIRGLLCNKCNFAIGLLNDDMELIEKVKMYLKERGEQDE